MKKAALITGCAKRIGEALAIELALKGYDLALHYNTSQKEVEILQKKILKIGVQAELVQSDLSQPETTTALLEKALNYFPHLNVLINNASVFQQSNLKNCSLEDVHRDFAVHVQSPLILIQGFAKYIQKGRIINIVDAAIKRNHTSHFSYLLAKKSLNDLTQMAAHELAPEILINAIAPGFILEPEEGMRSTDDRISQIPLQRKGTLKDVTSTMSFLLENNFITGQTLFVDGGEQ